jgi:hypothetical protein
MRRLVRRPSHATVVAYLALFVALSGTAYAAATLAPANSVNSRAIIDGQVKTLDLADSAVTGGKVAVDSIRGRDVKESTLGRVPNAAALGGNPASDFVASSDVVPVDYQSSCDASQSDCTDFPGERILAVGGLALNALCVGSHGSGSAQLLVFAQATTAGPQAKASVLLAEATTGGFSGEKWGAVIPLTGSPATLIAEEGGGTTKFQQGTIVYHGTGHGGGMAETVTMTFLSDEGDSGGTAAASWSGTRSARSADEQESE